MPETNSPTPAQKLGTDTKTAKTAGGVVARTQSANKVYGQGDTEVHALRDVTVEFKGGEFASIMGPSGSGKSTLMHCMAGLDRLTSGDAFVAETALSGLSDKDLTRMRRDQIGFIFQAFNLVPTLNVRENITLPMDLGGRKYDRDWVDEVITAVGLGDRISHRPRELSGGQQQRVAVARALASKPDIVFGDEPTGNLDSATSGEILEFMAKAVNDLGQTIVMVTHDANTASHSDRVLFLADGKIVHEMLEPTAGNIYDTIKNLGG